MMVITAKMVLKDRKEKLLTIGVAIIFVLFVGYSIYTFLNQDLGDEKYITYLFIISTLSGIMGIILGIIIKVESVGTGLMGGGILSILYGVIRHWEYSDNILKVIILGVVLGVLIWFGFKKFGKIIKK